MTLKVQKSQRKYVVNVFEVEGEESYERVDFESFYIIENFNS